MTTKQMEYVLELSRVLNYNRAAENLFISQSTLTYHIKEIEKEISFPIFNRSAKSVALTPAGAQFCISLRAILEDLKRAVEQGQNFNSQYRENIVICLPIRSALYFLPDAIIQFSRSYPDTSITPIFIFNGGLDLFLRGECDIFFSYENVKRIPGISTAPLYESCIYLITRNDDPLAQKPLITIEDLRERTLMVGGGSPPALQAVQQRVLRTVNIKYFNSSDHDTTLTNVAAGKGVCLAPGFLNDHNNEFSWTPFECPETIPCVLCSHENDKRSETRDFIRILQEIYSENCDFQV